MTDVLVAQASRPAGTRPLFERATRVGPATALALSRWLVERYDADPWVRRLVDTRTVLIMPMTNAIGVEQNRRDELGACLAS